MADGEVHGCMCAEGYVGCGRKKENISPRDQFFSSDAAGKTFEQFWKFSVSGMMKRLFAPYIDSML